MNIVNKVSKMDGIDEYILLSKESIERLVEGSKRLDDKSQKLILQLEKWIYENDMIEGPFDNYELQYMSNNEADFMYNWIRKHSGRVKLDNVTTNETNESGSKDNKNEMDNNNTIQSNEYSSKESDTK